MDALGTRSVRGRRFGSAAPAVSEVLELYLREVYACRLLTLEESGDGLYVLNGEEALMIFRVRGRWPLEVRKRRRKVVEERILIYNPAVSNYSRGV